MKKSLKILRSLCYQLRIHVVMFVIKVIFATVMLNISIPLKKKLIVMPFLEILILMLVQNFNTHHKKFQNGCYLNIIMEEEYQYPIIIEMIQGSDELGLQKSGSGQVWVEFESRLGRDPVKFRSSSGYNL